jgi:serine/threonine protein kinase
VYRATDTNLGRQVAIKVLRDALAGDPERLARFEREARTLATLNHPHIAQIYGVENADGRRGLVMELVEGETLADRITRGRLPFDEALPIARQITDALEAAHAHGIVHRDLKPANIKLRPDGVLKVLDFGLAKAVEPVSARGTDATASPPHLRPGSGGQAITSPALMTGAGLLLGTAAYMSPEQARGKAVDKRADIWAFGCVLYEMLTGKRAFDDEDISMTLSKVLQRDPDFDRFRHDVPRHVRQAIRLCLRKPLKERMPDIAAVRLVLDGAFETAPPTQAAAAPAQPVWRRAVPV